MCTALLCIDEARVDGELTPAPLNFSSEACRRIEQFSRELEPRLGPGCELSPICDCANKLAGGIARVAAVLHLAECASYCPTGSLISRTRQQALSVSATAVTLKCNRGAERRPSIGV